MALLLTESEEEADRLFETLERENRRRKEVEGRILSEAIEMIDRDVDLDTDRAIVLGGERWHPGVIGIVASRLVERYHRPVLLASLGERCRGSARSVPGLHINDALSRCQEHLLRFGGHSQAAGFEIERDGLSAFRRALLATIETPLEAMVPGIEADCPVRLDDLSATLLDEIGRLEPFGHGNPAPLLLAEDVEVVGAPRRMGADGQHLSFFVRSNGRAFRAVAFGQGERCDQIAGRSSRVSLLFEPTWNRWQGRRDIELRVRDLRVLDGQRARGGAGSLS